MKLRGRKQFFWRRYLLWLLGEEAPPTLALYISSAGLIGLNERCILKVTTISADLPLPNKELLLQKSYMRRLPANRLLLLNLRCNAFYVSEY